MSDTETRRRGDAGTGGRGDRDEQISSLVGSPCHRVSASPFSVSPFLRVTVSPRLRVPVSPRRLLS
jgi:hypothetical protein